MYYIFAGNDHDRYDYWGARTFIACRKSLTDAVTEIIARNTERENNGERLLEWAQVVHIPVKQSTGEYLELVWEHNDLTGEGDLDEYKSKPIHKMSVRTAIEHGRPGRI